MFKRLLQPLRKYKWKVLVLFLRWLFRGCMASWMNILYKYAIDALTQQDLETFLWMTGWIIAFFIVKTWPWYYFRTIDFVFASDIQRDIYSQHLALYIGLSNTETEKLGTWRINGIIQKWSDKRVDIIKQVPQVRTEKISVIILWLCTVFWILGREAWLVTLLWVCCMIAAGLYGNTTVTEFRRETRDALIHSDRTIVKMIMSKLEVMQTWKTSYELGKIAKEFDIIRAARRNESKGFIRGFDVPRWIMDAIRVCLFVYLWYGVVWWTYTIWDLVLVWWLMKLIELNIRRINDIITNFRRNFIFVEKLWETFDTIPTIEWYETGETFVYESGMVEIKNLTYGYTESISIFSDITLTFQWWKKTALVGISWSGKSTLVKLIAGYLRPDSGSITIDWQDLAEVSLKSYYPHIWYLTQEPSVFDGTIRENLLYAVDEATETQLQEAVTSANCEFIYDLQDGLDTEIWERGVRLSGWQRQRLAIAKIFLKNPQIILLDEPTSALDSFSEEAITEAMHALFENRTVIIIAHRLQTVKEADDIVLLGNQKLEIRDQKESAGSEVLERGTHEELVAMWGQYARMLEVQTWF